MPNVRGRRTITPAMSALGKLVRDRRDALHLTLRAAGEAAGVSFVTIRDIERGHVARPVQETLIGLSRALDIPMSELATAAYAEQPQVEAVT